MERLLLIRILHHRINKEKRFVMLKKDIECSDLSTRIVMDIELKVFAGVF